MTELSLWKLFAENGRLIWKYLPSENTIQTGIERYLLGLDTIEESTPRGQDGDVATSLRNGIRFYSQLQLDEGHWAHDYSGPLFLLPGLIFTCYITESYLPQSHKLEMTRYIFNHQNNDGGWGLHIESNSTMFGSVVNYVALRILGTSESDTRMVKARNWIHINGTAIAIPSWGKFWLATLGLYEWEGMNALMPELWLLPTWSPVHPGHFWSHCRLVYLPMSYIYGCKASMEPNILLTLLKKELYPQGYDNIAWNEARWKCCEADLYKKPSTVCKLLFGILNWYESIHNPWLRQKALNEVIKLIRVEDESTNYINIGPVNKAINMLSVFYSEGVESSNFQKHYEKIFDYLWLSDDGMKMQGYNGTQLWDTALSLQAIIESGFVHEFKDTLIKGHKYIDVAQVRVNIENHDRWYRNKTKGGWTFSTREQGWPVSDCTAEGLKAALMLRKLDFITPLDDDRYHDAVDIILSLQNANGGWSTYEPTRSSTFCELLNPSECFNKIMIDYSYPECTSSAIKALFMFKQHFPSYKIQAIAAGITYLKKAQLNDGSWYGSWAVCFTYSFWYVIDALIYVGESPNAPYIQKACHFISTKQREDGGWGESFESCVKQTWVEHEKSQTVNTAWSLIGLIKVGWNQEVIDRGIKLSNGDWKLESVSGAFNENCGIICSSYKNIFPIWALSAYVSKLNKG